MGVTRLSLGVENFDDRILEVNGRAHRSPEIARAYEFARALRFPADQHRPDRRHARRNRRELGGLRQADARARARQRHHLPDGAAVQHDDQQRPAEGHGGQFDEPVAQLVDQAALGGARPSRRSSAPATRSAAPTRPSRIRRRRTFVYRDRLWQGADLVGLGVASFGHVNGVHMQNLDTWETYGAAIDAGELPLGRAYRPTDEERMIREFVLQLKRGSVRPAYFRDKYGVDVLERFATAGVARGGRPARAARRRRDRAHARRRCCASTCCCTRFFLPQHAGIRYT